jgi:hypothetical protein
MLWDRGFSHRWARRVELGVGRLLLGSIAAVDWSEDHSRYCLNMVARAEK